LRVRRGLPWCWFSACGLALAAGCGSGHGAAFSYDGGSDDASASGSGGHGSSSGTVGGIDGAQADARSSDSTTTSSASSGGGPVDASIDIPFPDAFYGPDATVGSGGGADSGVEAGCSPNGITCAGTVAESCSGGTLTATDCAALPNPKTCAPGYGCVVCQPGTGTCSGNTGRQCKADGSGYTNNNCDPLQGESCAPTTGECAGDCANLGLSYIGCEYYAVTMVNHELDQTTFVFSVSIANTGTSAANINIQGGSLSTPLTASIAPGAIQGFVLPWVTALSQSLATTLSGGGAYHIRSTEPVTVYQFNARDYCVPSPSCTTTSNGSTYSYTNDASLLLPVNALTGNYRLAGAPTWESLSGGQYPGTIVVVGTANGTSVTVAPPGSPLLAGAGIAANGGTVTLNAGDVLQIATDSNAAGDGTWGTDPSGALITATAPVEVFGGSDCTYVPAGTQACDHLEQINFPVETLGKDYLVARPTNVNATPREFVKIIGTVDGTGLTYDGITGQPATVGAGGVVLFETTTDFRLTATHPIEVAEYMEGQEAFGTGCVVASPGGQTCGDPSMSLAVSTAQFRTQYPFTSPPNYYQNWANIIAANGTTVTVTDTPTSHTITSGTAIGSSGYYVASVPLCANNLSGCTGNHMATATVPFGIKVYGYGSATSYMYPGGLNLSRQ
jgi:hypothetical protein